MKKRIAKHISNQDFVKVYISDRGKYTLTHFEGFIFEQNDKCLFMSDSKDFDYDGLVIVRKADITEIRHTENEIFFQEILDGEKISDSFFKKRKQLDFSLGNWQSMFDQLHKLKIPIIIECKYKKEDRFLIGPVLEVKNKKVKLRYFNVRGEFDLKPAVAKFSDITFVRIDSPYATVFYKYTKEVS